MPARPVLAAVISLAICAGGASAGDLAQFHDAVETFSAHNRVAIGYLRTGNVELASAEIAAMREAWGTVVERFGNDRPPEFRDNPRYVTALVDVPTRLVGVSLMLTMGRTDLAGGALVSVRKELSELRRTSGIEILADCILDANAAMDRLIAFRDQPPDWTSPDAITDLSAAAEAYGSGVRRCDAMAPDDVRHLPEFRRLVDGVAASLAQMPAAVAARDGDLVHRLLIELQSFDNLLAFRYG
ncbi:hypothetical protein RA307_02055 [Xanthobacteraceae bacterium Astr-EGSB]|uniref:hypothetical protein n=1 Tax=Astrobacterium formosum TaxID=3069710 RepID=UPI0027ADAA3C|nr:hypothetical protein [Xanthobacteraceae bacterium Astr-EGSB]